MKHGHTACHLPRARLTPVGCAASREGNPINFHGKRAGNRCAERRFAPDGFAGPIIHAGRAVELDLLVGFTGGDPAGGARFQTFVNNIPLGSIDAIVIEVVTK